MAAGARRPGDGSLYDALGVVPSASSDEIRRAYLSLARRHHPDRHTAAAVADQVTAEARMRRVNEAWAVLGDPEKRARYDGRSPNASDTAPHRAWEPLDGFSADEFENDENDVDPELLDDTPFGDGKGVPRFLQLVPPLLVLLAVLGSAVGLVTGMGGLLALSIVALVLAGVLFFVAPLVALSRGTRHG